MNPTCDCTARCGDDPGISKKEVQPCEDYIRRMENSKNLEKAIQWVDVNSTKVSAGTSITISKGEFDMIATAIKCR